MASSDPTNAEDNFAEGRIPTLIDVDKGVMNVAESECDDRHALCYNAKTY